MNKQQIVVLVATEKGGPGKTTTTDTAATVSVAAGHSTLVIDVDDGNSGYLQRAGKGSGLALGWDTKAGSARPWLAEKVRDIDVVIFDLGANLVTSGAPVTEFLGEAVSQMKERGSRLVFLAVASPNAPGTGRLIRAMRDDYSSLADVYVVQNNVDGSNAFSKAIGTAGLTKISAARIDPGVMAVRLLRQEPLLDVLRAPLPGYELATARYAQFVAQFARQEPVRGLFGEGALPKLDRLAARAPGKLRYTIRSLDKASNEAIRANEKLQVKYEALRRADRTDRNLVYGRALEFIDADEAYISF